MLHLHFTLPPPIPEYTTRHPNFHSSREKKNSNLTPFLKSPLISRISIMRNINDSRRETRWKFYIEINPFILINDREKTDGNFTYINNFFNRPRKNSNFLAKFPFQMEKKKGGIPRTCEDKMEGNSRKRWGETLRPSAGCLFKFYGPYLPRLTIAFSGLWGQKYSILGKGRIVSRGIKINSWTRCLEGRGW